MQILKPAVAKVVVTRARDTINQLSKDVGQVGEVIESLATHTKSIGGILDVIALSLNRPTC